MTALLPCVMIRENTERPITVTYGTNVIAGTKKENIVAAVNAQLKKFSEGCTVSAPPLWDGKAAERIVEILTREPGARIQNSGAGIELVGGANEGLAGTQGAGNQGEDMRRSGNEPG